MEDIDIEWDDSKRNSRDTYILCTDECTGCKPVLGGNMQKGYTGTDKALEYLFENASEVEVTQELVQGVKIATIEIDGQPLFLYAPDKGGIVVANGKVSLS